MNASVKSGQVGPDLHKPGWLGEIAKTDPQLAIALDPGIVIPNLLGYNEPRCGDLGWQALNVSATFDAVTANQTIKGKLTGLVESDMWVRSVIYTVRRPNAFTASVFKAQSDYFNSLNPDIDLTLIIKGYCRYLISPDPTPLENIRQVFNDCCPQGLVFGCSSQIEMQVQNLRTLEADEVPTEVTLTFHGIRLRQKYDACSAEAACAALKAVGLL